MSPYFTWVSDAEAGCQSRRVICPHICPMEFLKTAVPFRHFSATWARCIAAFSARPCGQRFQFHIALAGFILHEADFGQFAVNSVDLVQHCSTRAVVVCAHKLTPSANRSLPSSEIYAPEYWSGHPSRRALCHKRSRPHPPIPATICKPDNASAWLDLFRKYHGHLHEKKSPYSYFRSFAFVN